MSYQSINWLTGDDGNVEDSLLNNTVSFGFNDRSRSSQYRFHADFSFLSRVVADAIEFQAVNDIPSFCNSSN